MDFDLHALREKFPFKPYEPAFRDDRLVQVMSFPTPSETIMVRTIPGDATTLVEIEAKELKSFLSQLLGTSDNVDRDTLAVLIERFGIEESPEVALLFVNECIREQFDLSASWMHVMHYLHDVLRRGAPENDRESVYTMTISELCDAVTTFVGKYYV